jgi:hypothetical protein
MQLTHTTRQPSARNRWACVMNSALQNETTGEPARPGTRSSSSGRTWWVAQPIASSRARQRSFAHQVGIRRTSTP